MAGLLLRRCCLDKSNTSERGPLPGDRRRPAASGCAAGEFAAGRRAAERGRPGGSLRGQPGDGPQGAGGAARRGAGRRPAGVRVVRRRRRRCASRSAGSARSRPQLAAQGREPDAAGASTSASSPHRRGWRGARSRPCSRCGGSTWPTASRSPASRCGARPSWGRSLSPGRRRARARSTSCSPSSWAAPTRPSGPPPPTSRDAEVLGVPAGLAGARRAERVTRAPTGEPVLLAEHVFPAHLHRVRDLITCRHRTAGGAEGR